MDFFDIRQQIGIDAAKREAAGAKSKADRTEDKVDNFQRTTERQISHLTLLCQSMWELLREQSGLTDNQLRAKIADIDTRDGRVDGKINPSVFQCPSCGANCNSSRQSCTMCGGDLKQHKPHIFET